MKPDFLEPRIPYWHSFTKRSIIFLRGHRLLTTGMAEYLFRRFEWLKSA